MSETEALNGLQIRRRELENELASLSQTEKYLKNDLKALEEKIIVQLEKEIKTKKSTLNGLESRKGELEKKLSDLQIIEGKTVQQEQQNPTEEDEDGITVVECETGTETVQNVKQDTKNTLVF
jgi:chromosome segregation ATPase